MRARSDFDEDGSVEDKARNSRPVSEEGSVYRCVFTSSSSKEKLHKEIKRRERREMVGVRGKERKDENAPIQSDFLGRRA